MIMSLPQLPTMKCDRGCGDCCGIVLCSRAEFQAVSNVVKMQGIVPVRQGSKCPLYIDGKCSVYHARPLTCRLFGHVDKLKCSRGYNANASWFDVLDWNAAIKKSGKKPVFLHELVYSIEEIKSLVEVEAGS